MVGCCELFQCRIFWDNTLCSYTIMQGLDLVDVNSPPGLLKTIAHSTRGRQHKLHSPHIRTDNLTPLSFFFCHPTVELHSHEISRCPIPSSSSLEIFIGGLAEHLGLSLYPYRSTVLTLLLSLSIHALILFGTPANHEACI